MLSVLTLCAYGALVGSTLWSCWRNEVMQAVGWALLFSWVASVAAHYFVSISDQPQAYTVCETAVLSMAFFSHVLGAGRSMVVLVAVSMVSIGSNFYVSSFDTLTLSQRNLWELTTNICFVLENLLVIGPMMYERLRRPYRRSHFGGGLVASHGRPAGADR